MRERVFTSIQKGSFDKHMLTIVSRDLLETTERHCLKSSQKHTIFSSKGTVSSTSQRSENVRLTIMKFHFRCMRVSSQKINLIALISSARSLFFLIEQMLSSFEFKGILNLKWAVISPFRSVATMPEEITASTMIDSFSSDSLIARNLIMTMFWTKIFSVSSRSFMKNSWSILYSFSWTTWTILLVAVNWFALSRFQSATTTSEETVKVNSSRINRFLIWAYWLKSIVNSNRSCRVKLELSSSAVLSRRSNSKNNVNCSFWSCNAFKSSSMKFFRVDFCSRR